MNRNRGIFKKIVDGITFPIRIFFSIGTKEVKVLGLSTFSDERYDYVSSILKDKCCLDVGCGSNRFIKEYMDGNGVGIDIAPYEGLDEKYVVKDLSKLPFQDKSFEAVTFIANFNHVPRDVRDKELSEAYRCLKDGGNIIITCATPLAGKLVHNLSFIYLYKIYPLLYHRQPDGLYDERDDELSIKDSEIYDRLQKAGFKNFTKKYFHTQWMLNHMIIARKDEG